MQISKSISNNQINKSKNLSLIGLFTIGLFVYFSEAAKAQTFSLGIYPPLLEVMIMPGKSVTQDYQLSNSGDETEITAQIVKFKPADELGNVSLRGLTSDEVRPHQGWFSFENAEIALGEPFLLKTGEKKQIILKVKIPEETAEDDYYFTLLFSTQPISKIALLGTKQAGVIGSNILITVSKDGQPVKKGEIVEFRLLDCYFEPSEKQGSSRRLGSYIAKLLPFCLIDSFDKPEFLLRVKNTGRAFWKPFGKLKTEGLLGQKWEQDLRPDNILADSIRQINLATPSASPSFLIGPYRASVEFKLDEDGPQVAAQTSFLALPFKAIFALLTIVLLVVTIKSVIKKRSKR